jgi:hypothetical protein
MCKQVWKKSKVVTAFWYPCQPTHFGGQLISLWLFIVLAAPLSDVCRTKHHVHNQVTCYHHSYPPFLTPPPLHYSTSGLHMLRKNSTTEIQYTCLGYFIRNSHNNVPENTSPPLLMRKICVLLSDFHLFSVPLEIF